MSGATGWGEIKGYLRPGLEASFDDGRRRCERYNCSLRRIAIAQKWVSCIILVTFFVGVLVAETLVFPAIHYLILAALLMIAISWISSLLSAWLPSMWLPLWLVMAMFAAYWAETDTNVLLVIFLGSATDVWSFPWESILPSTLAVMACLNLAMAGGALVGSIAERNRLRKLAARGLGYTLCCIFIGTPAEAVAANSEETIALSLRCQQIDFVASTLRTLSVGRDFGSHRKKVAKNFRRAADIAKECSSMALQLPSDMPLHHSAAVRQQLLDLIDWLFSGAWGENPKPYSDGTLPSVRLQLLIGGTIVALIVVMFVPDLEMWFKLPIAGTALIVVVAVLRNTEASYASAWRSVQEFLSKQFSKQWSRLTGSE